MEHKRALLSWTLKCQVYWTTLYLTYTANSVLRTSVLTRDRISKVTCRIGPLYRTGEHVGIEALVEPDQCRPSPFAFVARVPLNRTSETVSSHQRYDL